MVRKIADVTLSHNAKNLLVLPLRGKKRLVMAENRSQEILIRVIRVIRGFLFVFSSGRNSATFAQNRYRWAFHLKFPCGLAGANEIRVAVLAACD